MNTSQNGGEHKQGPHQALQDLEEWFEQQEFNPWDYGFRKVCKDLGLFLVGLFLLLSGLFVLGWVVETWRERPHLIEDGIYGSLPALFAVEDAHAWVQTPNSSGRGEHWRSPAVALTFRLGCQDTGRIERWGPCWDDVAQHAMEAWNRAGSRFRFTGTTRPSTARPSCLQYDDTRVVVWGRSFCGDTLGSGTLAITGNWAWPDTGVLVDSDIMFNTYFEWAAYPGPYRYNQPDLHRVAMHEFGHVFGLTHPDDHGQRVRAIMNANADDTETLQPDDIAGIQAIYGRDPNTRVTTKGALGNPGHQTYASGVGVISGWVCDAQRVEVQIGTKRIRMAYGTNRPDTQGVCGDANNGFVTLVNYNNLGDGVHTARLVVDGQRVGQPAQFKVTTFGTDFLRGVEGGYWLYDFPRVGEDVGIGWNQGRQNFVIEERR